MEPANGYSRPSVHHQLIGERKGTLGQTSSPEMLLPARVTAGALITVKMGSLKMVAHVTGSAPRINLAQDRNEHTCSSLERK
jgi:hypothetical protein